MPASYMSKYVAIVLLVLVVTEYLCLFLAVLFAGHWPFNLIAMALGCILGVLVMILYVVHERLYRKRYADNVGDETASLLPS